jgi:3-deoxy-D-manno-octulosonic-acid transferase
MFLYRLLSILFLPLIYIYLVFRLIKGKEDKNHFKERLGFPGTVRPKGKVYWIHSVSVGESNSAFVLINKLLDDNIDITILFTSTTITSASSIKSAIYNNPRIIHQFLPVDDIFSAKRFIKYWKPRKSIFIESEIWPNLIYEAAKSGSKLALINARISIRSTKRWLSLHNMGFNVLKHFQISFAQSLSDKERLISLGLRNTKYIGNLKSCARTLDFDETKLNDLSKHIGVRKFWLASSTHKGEEEIIINIHQKLKKYHNDILTIIAPRHPARLGDIIKIIPEHLSVAIRSRGDKISSDTDIYIADTFAELGLLYKLSNISFIAGSLKDNIGGHNPFEALKLGSAVISGSYLANFIEIYDNLKDNNAAIIVKDEEELLFYLLKLLKNSEFRKTMIESGNAINKNSDNIVLEIAKELK